MARQNHRCSRCQGFLVECPCTEWDWVPNSTDRMRPIMLWRCVNCGHRTDAVMEVNRGYDDAPARLFPRRRGPARPRVRPQISWLEMRQVLRARRSSPRSIAHREIWRQVQEAVAAAVTVA